MRSFRFRIAAVFGTVISLALFASGNSKLCASAHSVAPASKFKVLQQASFESFLALYGLEPDPQNLTWSKLRGPMDGFGQGGMGILEHNPDLNVRRVYPMNYLVPEQHVLLSPIRQSHFENFEIPNTVWRLKNPDQGSSQFRVFNIGYRQLTKDWPEIEKTIRQGFIRHPGKILQIPYHPAFDRAFLILDQFHRWASLLATDVYSDRKKYLKTDELFELRDGDLDPSAHDDYLVLQKDASRSILDMNFEQFQDNTLAVVRMVRYGFGYIYYPQSLLGPSVFRNQLPVFKRYRGTLTGQRIDETLQALHMRGRKNIAEISRFVRVQDFPNSLLNHLMLDVFNLALLPEQRTDILIISVDSRTRRLFRTQYKFKDLAPLTEDTSDTPEYLMYLDTQSPEFQEVRTQLKALSSAVTTVSPLPFRPEYKAKPEATAMNYPPRWHVGSYEERMQQTREKIKKVQAQQAPILKQEPIEWHIPGLRDLPATSIAQVKEIANWAIDPSQNQAAVERFQKMTPAEFQILRQRTKVLWHENTSALEYSLGTIKQGTDVLIIGDRPEHSEQWKEFVRDDVDPHRIQTGTIQSLQRQRIGSFDNVILILPELALLSKEQVASILEGASQALRPGGSITLMSEFGPYLEGPEPLSRQLEQDHYELVNYAVFLSHEISLTEAEVALATLVRQEDIRLRRRARLRERDVQDIFKRLKFLGDTSAQLSAGWVFNSSVLIWLKPKD